jgi:hypothetical protein
MVARLGALPFTPVASEVLSANVSQALGLEDCSLLLVRLAGNEKSVKSQADLVMEFGDRRDVDDAVWTQLRAIETPGGGAWRWSQLPSLFGETWAAADLACKGLDDVLMHGSPVRGVVRVLARGDADSLARAAGTFSGTIAIEQLPAAAWSGLQVGPSNDAIARAIREKFDPATILNPGILGRTA